MFAVIKTSNWTGFRQSLEARPQERRRELHTHCALSFGMRSRLKAAQLNTNTQSTLAKPRSFTFLRGPICFSHAKGFSTNQRLLKLMA